MLAVFCAYENEKDIFFLLVPYIKKRGGMR